MKAIFKELWGEVGMKTRYGISFMLGAFFCFIILYLTSCAMIKNIKPDSFLEELTEEVIENYTGIDLDLTPSSQEQ